MVVKGVKSKVSEALRANLVNTSPETALTGRRLKLPGAKKAPGRSLKQFVLERHVGLGLEADAGAEDVGQGAALLGQGVDDGRTGRGHRRLEHVAEDAQDAVEALVVARGARPPLDARHHLGHDDQVDDQRRGQEGVLADVEEPVARTVSIRGRCRRDTYRRRGRVGGKGSGRMRRTRWSDDRP